VAQARGDCFRVCAQWSEAERERTGPAEWRGGGELRTDLARQNHQRRRAKRAERHPVARTESPRPKTGRCSCPHTPHPASASRRRLFDCRPRVRARIALDLWEQPNAHDCFRPAVGVL